MCFAVIIGIESYVHIYYCKTLLSVLAEFLFTIVKGYSKKGHPRAFKLCSLPKFDLQNSKKSIFRKRKIRTFSRPMHSSSRARAAARAAVGLRSLSMKPVKLHGMDKMGLRRRLSLDDESYSYSMIPL